MRPFFFFFFKLSFSFFVIIKILIFDASLKLGIEVNNGSCKIGPKMIFWLETKKSGICWTQCLGQSFFDKGKLLGAEMENTS